LKHRRGDAGPSVLTYTTEYDGHERKRSPRATEPECFAAKQAVMAELTAFANVARPLSAAGRCIVRRMTRTTKGHLSGLEKFSRAPSAKLWSSPDGPSGRSAVPAQGRDAVPASASIHSHDIRLPLGGQFDWPQGTRRQSGFPPSTGDVLYSFRHRVRRGAGRVAVGISVPRRPHQRPKGAVEQTNS